MKVLIIDDDKLVCTSLQTILEADSEITVSGIGHDGMEAIRLYKDLQPDILLMDIRMNQMTGLEAGERILSQYSSAKILFLTTFADDEYIVRALKIGAKGYILKQNFESIVASLKAVYMGQRVFGDAIIDKIPTLMNAEKQDYKGFGITEKEFDIIRLVADGMSNKEIANHLFLGEGTVRNTISLILDKLSLRDRTQLAIFYLSRKFVTN